MVIVAAVAAAIAAVGVAGTAAGVTVTARLRLPAWQLP